MQERTGLPVYDLSELQPAQPPVTAAAPDPEWTVRKATPREMRRAYRSIERAGRLPIAILPWVGVALGLIWWPLLALGVWSGIVSYRYGHRGAGPALIALGCVAVLHIVNRALGHPWL